VNRGSVQSRASGAAGALSPGSRAFTLARVGHAGGKWKPITWTRPSAKWWRSWASCAPLVIRTPVLITETGSSPRLVDAFSLGLAATTLDWISSQRGRQVGHQYMMGSYGLPNTISADGLVAAMGTDLLESSGQAMHFWRTQSARRQRVLCVSRARPAAASTGGSIAREARCPGAVAGHVLVADDLIDRTSSLTMSWLLRVEESSWR